MATALKFIVLFLIAYKVFSLLFNNNQQKVKTKQNQQFKQSDSSNNTHTITKTDYEEAEFIDYEEVK